MRDIKCKWEKVNNKKGEREKKVGEKGREYKKFNS